MAEAIQMVHQNKMTSYVAAKHYGIPRTTIADKIRTIQSHETAAPVKSRAKRKS